MAVSAATQTKEITKTTTKQTQKAILLLAASKTSCFVPVSLS